MRINYTATVQFAGAGGTSEGARQAGIEVQVAINHSPIAIATHARNHPETQHYTQSMETCDPYELPATDFLLTSPCCTNHSVAKGRRRIDQLDLFGEIVYDPQAEDSRNTMEDVPRFTRAMQDTGTPYKFIAVENVVDVLKWRKFPGWLSEMKSLGYEYKCLCLNTMFFGVPQSRDRVYLLFWLPGFLPDLDFRPVARCEKCQQVVKSVQSFKRPGGGRYQKQYVYRCPTCAREVVPHFTQAWTAIDWSLPCGKPIGERTRPLKPKTLARVQAGLDKYGSHDPLLVSLEFGGSDESRARPVILPAMTQTTAQATALVLPPHADRTFLMSYYNNAGYKRVDEPIGTITTLDRYAVVTPSPTYQLEACRLRMLSPDEVKRFMGFPENYVLLGTARQQVWMAGNAVCPPIMRAILERGTEALDAAQVREVIA